MKRLPGFRRERADGRLLYLREGARDWLREVLAGDFAGVPADARTPVQGRGKHFAFETEEGRVLARRVLRGGWISFMGPNLLSARRVFNEVHMLEAARSAGLRVPEILGFSIRRGLFKNIVVVYREIEGAVTLEEAIRRGRPGLEAAARETRKMHGAGILHGDLNCRNILLRGDGVHFVDFDRARLSRSESAQRRELARLFRSLAKELGKGFTGEHRRRIVEAYAGGPDEVLLQMCERRLRVHERFWR